jgi:DNA-binding transcriptional regulator YdaS (Cro superfamily)
MTETDDLAELKAAGLEEAKRAVDGNTGLSRALNAEVTPQAISQWRQVPAGRVLKVESATGVPRHRLRPDLYPPPPRDGLTRASNQEVAQ